MNPLQVAQARTARLAAEARKPVFSTSTPERAQETREHMVAVEIETDYGYRYWSTMPESHARDFICAEQAKGNYFSDQDHAVACWCMG